MITLRFGRATMNPDTTTPKLPSFPRERPEEIRMLVVLACRDEAAIGEDDVCLARMDVIRIH